MRTDGVYSNAMGVSLDKSAWTPYAHTDDVVPRDGPAAADPAAQAGLARASPRGASRELEPQIQRITDHYLDARAARRASFDWIADFAGRLPMDVISEMLGRAARPTGTRYAAWRTCSSTARTACATCRRPASRPR